MSANLYKSGSNARSIQPAEFSAASLKVVKTDIAPTGEAIQLVRPMVSQPDKSTEQIVGELVNKYDYKKAELVRASDSDISAINQAFGSNLASKLLSTYDGSAIITDTQQDLIGEKYLEEQIKRAHDYQKKNSVIDRYAHLLYEGDKNYTSHAKDDVLKVYKSSSSFAANLKPVQQQEFLLQQSKLQPSSSRLIASNANLQPSQSQVKQPSLQPSQSNLQASRQSNTSQLSALQEQIKRLQEEKQALENSQKQYLLKEREEQERQRRAHQERLAQEQAIQEQLLQDQQQLKQQMETLLTQQRQQQQQQQQQGSKLSSSSTINASNLKSVTIDAYNDPQFKALLDQISKPLNAPAENIELPAQWPSDGSLEHLADPIIIPAPEPIVISAPEIIKLTENYSNSNLQSHFKTEVKFYPKNVDQKFYSNFDMSQLSVNNRK